MALPSFDKGDTLTAAQMNQIVRALEASGISIYPSRNENYSSSAGGNIVTLNSDNAPFYARIEEVSIPTKTVNNRTVRHWHSRRSARYGWKRLRLGVSDDTGAGISGAFLEYVTSGALSDPINGEASLSGERHAFELNNNPFVPIGAMVELRRVKIQWYDHTYQDKEIYVFEYAMPNAVAAVLDDDLDSQTDYATCTLDDYGFRDVIQVNNGDTTLGAVPESMPSLTFSVAAGTKIWAAIVTEQHIDSSDSARLQYRLTPLAW